MNKAIIIILIILGLILFLKRIKTKENMIKENMTTDEKEERGCPYNNSLNIKRGMSDCSNNDGNEQCKCYFNYVTDSDLGINTLQSILKDNLYKKQIPINKSKNFFNYQNLSIAKPSYKERNSNVINRKKIGPSDVSRIPYILHNDLFVRYYLSKLNQNLYPEANNKINNFFNRIMEYNVLDMNKVIYDKREDGEHNNRYSLETVYLYNKNT